VKVEGQGTSGRMSASPALVRAIGMVCLGSLCYTLNDTVTKFLIDRYSVVVIIFVRSVMALPMLWIMAIVIGRDRVRWSAHMPLYAARGALGVLAAFLYIWGLETLSVAEATVVVFASPFIVTAGSALLFKERVGWTKWVAVAIGFCGVLVAVQPGSNAFQPASLLILICAFLYASIALSSRWVRHEDNLWTVSFFGAAFSALYIAPMTIGSWTSVHAEDLLLFASAAMFSSFAVGLATLAYRSVPASELSPFAYSGLIWSTGVTWIVWDAVPSLWTIVGGLIVACSGVFHVLFRRASSEAA
jgi:drug/metabolite transporter (DMT)-like permease